MKKRFVLIMLICLAFCFSMKDTACASSYDGNAAIMYAKSHMSNGHSGSWNCPSGWLCADFVSHCLSVGGLDCNYSECRSLYNFCLQKGSVYTLEKGSSYGSDFPVKSSGNGSNMTAGDVLISYCPTCDLYLHAVIVSGESGGYLYGYSHNANKNNEQLWMSNCDNGHVPVVYGIDLNTTNGSSSEYISGTNTDKEAPVIKNVKVTILSTDMYKVECDVTDNVGVAKVVFPTWTSKNGQDDITWDEGSWTGNHYTCTIWNKKHNDEFGDYITHIYAYDAAQNEAFVDAGSISLDNAKPVISNIKVSDITEDGYTVSCTVTDDDEITKVLFPTWTENNGQDDINWYNSVKNGNTYSCTVKTTNHNNETGVYITHIYAWDKCGNEGSGDAGKVTVLPKDDIAPDIYELFTISTPSNPAEVYVFASVKEENISSVVIQCRRNRTPEGSSKPKTFDTRDYSGNMKYSTDSDSLPSDVKEKLLIHYGLSQYALSGNTYMLNQLFDQMKNELWFKKYDLTDYFASEGKGDQGEYTFKVNASDKSGNTVNKDIHYFVDREVPVVSWFEVFDVTSNGFDVLCYAEDNMGVDHVLFYGKPADNEESQGGPKTFTFDQNSDDISITGYRFTDYPDDDGYDDAYEKLVNAGYDPSNMWLGHVVLKEVKHNSYDIYAIVYDGANSVETESYNVKLEQKVESVSIDKKEITIKEGESIKLTANVAPSDASNKATFWESGDIDIAFVNDGIVTGIEEGETVITVYAGDGNIKDTCKVSVLKRENTNAVDSEDNSNTDGSEVVSSGDSIDNKDDVNDNNQSSVETDKTDPEIDNDDSDNETSKTNESEQVNNNNDTQNNAGTDDNNNNTGGNNSSSGNNDSNTSGNNNNGTSGNGETTVTDQTGEHNNGNSSGNAQSGSDINNGEGQNQNTGNNNAATQKKDNMNDSSVGQNTGVNVQSQVTGGSGSSGQNQNTVANAGNNNRGSNNTGTSNSKPVSILPGFTDLKSVKAKKKSIVVKWEEDEGCIGYQIQYSTTRSFAKGTKTKTVKSEITSKTIKKLKAGKKYYVRVRSIGYKENGERIYGVWSEVKKVKVKK